nr:DUF559 domain-containing protein [uncultured Brevundimonas sp.]
MEKPSDRNRAFARRSRGAMTDTETELWRLLRDRRLHGIKFRRQVLIGPYVADFACWSSRLTGVSIVCARKRMRTVTPGWPRRAIRFCASTTR